MALSLNPNWRLMLSHIYVCIFHWECEVRLINRWIQSIGNYGQMARSLEPLAFSEVWKMGHRITSECAQSTVDREASTIITKVSWLQQKSWVSSPFVHSSCAWSDGADVSSNLINLSVWFPSIIYSRSEGNHSPVYLLEPPIYFKVQQPNYKKMLL